MALQDLKPTTRIARVLPLVDAIRNARARGITWVQITAEIGTQVGVDPAALGAANALRAAYRAACQQMEKGRLATPPPTAATYRPTREASISPAAAKGEAPTGERPARPGFTNIPIDK